MIVHNHYFARLGKCPIPTWQPISQADGANQTEKSHLHTPGRHVVRFMLKAELLLARCTCIIVQCDLHPLFVHARTHFRCTPMTDSLNSFFSEVLRPFYLVYYPLSGPISIQYAGTGTSPNFATICNRKVGKSSSNFCLTLLRISTNPMLHF